MCNMAAMVDVFVDEIMKSFLRYTGYKNFIKYQTNHVLLLRFYVKVPVI